MAIRPLRNSGVFEAFCRKIVEMIEAQPELWRHTAS